MMHADRFDGRHRQGFAAVPPAHTRGSFNSSIHLADVVGQVESTFLVEHHHGDRRDRLVME